MFGIIEKLEEIKSLIIKGTQNHALTISYGPESAVVLYTNHISSIKSISGKTNIYMDNGDVYQTTYSLQEVQDIIAGKLAAGNNKLYATPHRTEATYKQTIKID